MTGLSAVNPMSKQGLQRNLELDMHKLAEQNAQDSNSKEKNLVSTPSSKSGEE
jgi:hypothetical protein